MAGCVGPWLRIDGLDVQAFDAHRGIVSAAAGLAAVLVLLGRGPVRAGVAVCGLVALGLTGYRVLDLSILWSQIGWGLWIAFAGSLALLASAARG